MRRVFYCVWVLLLGLCGFVLLGTGFKALGRRLIFEETRNGYASQGFYELTLLEDNWENIKVYDHAVNPPLESAEVITFGDSFFDAVQDSPLFSEVLTQRLGRPVYNHASWTFENPNVDHNPAGFLGSVQYRKGEKKFLILESVERLAFLKSGYYQPGEPLSGKKNLVNRLNSGMNWRLRSADQWLRKYVILLNNDNPDCRHFLANNALLYPVSKWIAEAKFRWLGDIHPLIDRHYDRRSEMFFFAEEVAFNRRVKPVQKIESLVENVVQAARELREKYNIELIYLIMPNKYTIYNDLVRPAYDYDGFIPKINELLAEQGVRTIDVYSAYIEYRRKGGEQWLYYPSGSHYTPLGKDILADAVAKELRTILSNERTVNPHER